MKRTSNVAVIIQATSPLCTAASTPGAAWAKESTGDSSRAAGRQDLRISLDIFSDSSRTVRSDCGRAGLAGADADDLLEVEDEDLAVADLAGAGGVLDRLDGLDAELVDDGRLDLDLGKEVDDVLGATVELGMALLATEPLHFGDGDALDHDPRKGLADLVELERLDVGGDEFHGFSPGSGGRARRSCRLAQKDLPMDSTTVPLPSLSLKALVMHWSS